MKGVALPLLLATVSAISLHGAEEEKTLHAHGAAVKRAHLSTLLADKSDAEDRHHKLRALKADVEDKLKLMMYADNRWTWNEEKQKLLARLETQKAACVACEAAEAKLAAEYEKAIAAHTLVEGIDAEVLKVATAQTEYDTKAALFNKQPLLDSIAAFKLELNIFSVTSTTDLPTPDFSGAVAKLNAQKAAAQAKQTLLEAAKTASIATGLCSDAAGAAKMCDISDANAAKTAATTADSSVATAKGARDSSCSMMKTGEP